ncbi:PREDICTED: protein moonraker [Nanorana parkeri]|uniref:protein moonraker n=1 Tax=Nanorana parkeri TaxID=125878 RepID=UPI000854C12F|nr:PREDICTED: protein moonraker [Nanorana parkeri]
MALDSQPGPSAVPGAQPCLPFRNHGRGTQLRFNLDVTTHPSNLATQFSNPPPIIIEKISGLQNKSFENVASDDLLRNSGSSKSFSIISEERLNLAVWLAKRDLKQKRLQEKFEGKLKSRPSKQHSPQFRRGVIISSPGKANARTFAKDKKPNGSIKHEVTKSGAVIYVYTPDRNKSNVGVSDSPPTHDPGPGTSPKIEVEQNEQEVRCLQKELHSCMRKIEELVKKESYRETLDPTEEARGRIRQQERAARSARMLYDLQHQVKEIQEDLEKLSPHKIKHTKKSRTVSRLAAVHRGTIRALQMFITQLNERGEQQIPSLYKELGHLIRQLSLCTAKLENEGDPAASKMIISILQQAENLDLLLKDKISSQARKVSPNSAAARSPHTRKSTNDTRSPTRRGCGPPPVLKQKLPPEENQKRVNRRLLVDEPPESLSAATQTEPEPGTAQETLPQERQTVLRSAIETLIHSGHLNRVPRGGAGQNRNKGILIRQRPQGIRLPRKMEPSRHAHFQEKTVAFKLKENRPVIKEKRTPWVPPNPTSPPASLKRVNWNREKKRLDDSPSRLCNEIDSLKENETEKEDVTKEASRRLAWFDSEMAKRVHQIDDLYRKAIADAQDLREEVHAVKDLVDDDFAKRNASRQQPKSQKDSFPEKQRDESLRELDSFDRNDYTNILPQEDSNVEAMIERIEEIEKYQELVCQRFQKIVYSDPDFWAQEEKERLHTNTVKNPSSPHPIRFTKATGQRTPVVEILLEKPVEGDSLQINKEELSRSSPHHFIPRPGSHDKGLIPISVPHQMLQSIQNYTETFDRHLRLTSHEEVGAFNPWYIAESLAEEIMNDALGEVAAELHEFCDDYAEAVFTSEFMEPAENNH